MAISIKVYPADYVFNEPNETNLTISINGIKVYSGNRMFDKQISTIIRYVVKRVDFNRVIKIEKCHDKTFPSCLEENNALAEYIHQACNELPLTEIKDNVMLSIYLELNELERIDYYADGYRIR